MSETDDHLRMTAQIVAAYISKGNTDGAALPTLIADVYRSLSTVGTPPAGTVAQEPAVPIKKSVFPDYLVCLEDGRKMKSMKRHLRVSFNMTPDEYRTKWGLPFNYPMVAPDYAARRSALAKDMGLGKRAEPAPVTKAPARQAKRSRG